MPRMRHTAGWLSLVETCKFFLESNHPSHRSVARLSPPIRKRQEGCFKKTYTPLVRLRIGGVFIVLNAQRLKHHFSLFTSKVNIHPHNSENENHFLKHIHIPFSILLQ